MKTPRIRHARRRSFVGAERGSTGIKRLRRHNLFLVDRLQDEPDGIGDTGAGTAFTPEQLAAVAATGVLTATGNPTGSVAASGTLTGTTIAADDTVQVDDVTYTFVTALSTGPTVPDEVLVGASDSDSLDNLIAAINGAAGEGTLYSVGTSQPTAAVTAAAGAGDTMDLFADVRGTAGNAIDTLASLSAGDWGAATLEGGVDGDTVTIGSTVYTFNATTLVDEPFEVLVGGSASATLDNLIDAINGEDGGGEEGTVYGTGTTAHPDVTAAAGAGDTIDLEAAVAGADGNAIATVCAPTDDIDFGAATLEGGIDANEELTATSHGFVTGDGPFLAVSDDTLPAGLAEDTLYWLRRVDANTVTLHRSRREAGLNLNQVETTDGGTGTHTLTPAASREGLNAVMRQGVGSIQIRALSDIDSLPNYY